MPNLLFACLLLLILASRPDAAEFVRRSAEKCKNFEYAAAVAEYTSALESAPDTVSRSSSSSHTRHWQGWPASDVT